MINHSAAHLEQSMAIAHRPRQEATEHFYISTMNQKIAEILSAIVTG